MIVRMGLFQKRSDLDLQEFRRLWREGHGPVASKLKGLRRYHQNHIVSKEQLGITYARGANDFDGISQLWFDDVPSMQRAFSGDYMKTLIEDEARIIGDLKLVSALQHVVIPTPKGVPLLKRMSTLKRRPDVGRLQARVVRHPFVLGKAAAASEGLHAEPDLRPLAGTNQAGGAGHV